MMRSEVPERQCPSCYAVRAVWITGCMNSIHFVSTKEWAQALVQRIHNFPSPDDDVVLLTALREAEARGLDDAEALADGKWRQAVMAVYPSLLAMSDEPPIEVLSFMLKEKERKAEARGLEDAALQEQLAQVTEDLRKCRDEIGEYR